MLPGASGSSPIPRKMAGSAMMTIEPSSVAMNMDAVVFVSATQRYRSLTTAGVLPIQPSDALGQALDQRCGRHQRAELRGCEPGLQRLRQLRDPRVALVAERGQARLGH